MGLMIWLLLSLLSLSAGSLLAIFLTVHPLRMCRALFGMCLAGFSAAILLSTRLVGVQLALGGLLSIVCACAGYVGMAWMILSRQDTRKLPALTRTRADPGLGHTAIVYFTHGEPETYDPIGWINQFREFDDQGIAFVPFLVRPLFLHMLRRKYLQVGRSDHRRMHSRMLASLREAYRREGDSTTRFYLCFLDDHPRPDAAVIQALNEGASRIIVSEVFLTISNHTAEGKALIEEVPLEDFGVPVDYTGPLYDSETLQSMFVQRANAHLDGSHKSRVGILLVGHGQPQEWDRTWPTETAQEIGFREDVLKLLEADGYSRENLGLAWMEFREPRPAPKVEEFVRNGAEKVMYFSAAISANSIHSEYDVPALVNKASVRTGFPLLNLGAWNDNPLVIRAIKEKIDARMASPTP